MPRGVENQDRRRYGQRDDARLCPTPEVERYALTSRVELCPMNVAPEEPSELMRPLFTTKPRRKLLWRCSLLLLTLPPSRLMMIDADAMRKG